MFVGLSPSPPLSSGFSSELSGTCPRVIMSCDDKKDEEIQIKENVPRFPDLCRSDGDNQCFWGGGAGGVSDWK